jgi:hypothetical protein
MGLWLVPPVFVVFTLLNSAPHSFSLSLSLSLSEDEGGWPFVDDDVLPRAAYTLMLNYRLMRKYRKLSYIELASFALGKPGYIAACICVRAFPR